MKVEQIEVRNALRNYTYVIYNFEEKDAWVIDPYSAAQVSEFLYSHNLTLKGVINTHSHHDHIKGNKTLLSKYSCPHIHSLDNSLIYLSHGSYLQSLFLPGHSPDHVCYLLNVEGRDHSFFSGDLIFDYGIGNTKNGGDFEQLYKSIQKVLTVVGGELAFYPGHDYKDSNLNFLKSILDENIGSWEPSFQHQLKSNLFLRLNDAKLRKKVAQKFSIESLSAQEYLLLLRRKRDQW